MEHCKTSKGIRFKEKKWALVKGGLFLFFVLGLFSCGLLDDLGSSAPRADFLDSRSEEDESAGVFNSPSGPLESEDLCVNNDDCVQLCDSMLSRFSNQEKCYGYKEKEVQAFRDTYNVLAIGNPRKLIRVDSEKMEEFLIFGPELWKTAINGFERGRIEYCEPELDPNDIRDYEDCKFETYYKQEGYWSSGAAATLEWIARNSWLAKLMVEHDDDHEIIQTLLDVLAKGGDGEAEDRMEDGEDGVSICNLDLESENGNGNGRLDLEDPSPPPPANVSVPSQQEDRYKAFGASCIDDHSLSYMLLAVEENNKDSVNLGHQVVGELCNSRGHCIEYFYCSLYGPMAEVAGSIAAVERSLFLRYMSASGIPGWNSDYNNCTYYE